MNNLVDKYRPRRLSQVIGQDKIIKQLRAVIGRSGYDGGALWIEGPTGTGKTSIAQAIATELDCEPGSVFYEELDGDKCNVESVRALDDKAMRSGHGLFREQWRVVIVNESHSMTARAVQAWLTLLERLPDKWLVIFTTTEDSSGLFGGFSTPFLDRCLCFRLTNQGLCEKFARLAHRIATREGLNGHPLEAYQGLVKKSHNSMRSTLQKIQAGKMLE